MDSKNLSAGLANFALPGGGYGYTGLQIGDAKMATENTCATGLLDESGSTDGFQKEMEACVKEIVRSMRHSPRADNLLYRHAHFGSRFREAHGFKPLSLLNEADYDGCYKPGGCTTLYDSCDSVIRATRDYGENMMKQKYLCNGIIYMITDGLDYGSTLTMADVQKALAQAVSSEALESIITILVGVNADPGVQKGLEDFAAFCGFTQYVPISKANEKHLARLAEFISQSISSQSQALGSGGPSKSLTF